MSTCFGHAEDVSNEYRVKAAMIYKLSKFVAWPEEGRDAFLVCALGPDVFGPALSALEGKQVRGAEVIIQRPETVDQAVSCDVVFLSTERIEMLEEAFRKLGGKPVLTIGDAEGFAEYGGIVQLANRDNRIKLIINQTSAKLSGLKISAPLLDLATVIE